MSTPQFDENEILSTRSLALIMFVMTVLFTVCWLSMQVAAFQAGTFISGLLTVMVWLNYCQQKTVAAIEQQENAQER